MVVKPILGTTALPSLLLVIKIEENSCEYPIILLQLRVVLVQWLGRVAGMFWDVFIAHAGEYLASIRLCKGRNFFSGCQSVGLHLNVTPTEKLPTLSMTRYIVPLRLGRSTGGAN